MHTRKFFEKIVRNELHDLPDSLQQETINRLEYYNNDGLSMQKIKRILQKIRGKYEETKIEAGEPVGVVAAQSLGEPSTQLILRTFHYAGVHTKHTTGGLDRLQEIINATYKIKEPEMEIYLNDGTDPEKVVREIEKMRNIEMVRVMQTEAGGVVIYTQGSNLEGVLGLEGVDKRRTRTNNIQEIEEVLGIEAARESIIEQLYDIYQTEGLEVDIRHIILVADMMTQNGTVQGLGRIGVMKQKSSIIARMAFEETTGILYHAAVAGIRDELRGVTENIIAGTVIRMGSGEVRLGFKSFN